MEAEEDAEEEGESAAEGSPSESSGQFEQGERDGGRRRRRGRRGRGGKGRRGEGRQPSHDGAPHDQHAEGDAETSESGEFGRPEANGELADQHGAPREDEGDGERKRRRRGRRGGRRNRRGREGNGDFNRDDAQDHAHASDFSSPAPMEQPAHHEPSEIQRDVPSTANATSAESAPAADSQAQRRRSTVREAAPGFSSSDTPQSPPPETPASAPAEGASSDQPRRFGWWSRKS
jgi:ribonuclease E